jgi:hypothetical protein
MSFKLNKFLSFFFFGMKEAGSSQGQSVFACYDSIKLGEYKICSFSSF